MNDARHNTCQVVVGRLLEIVVAAGYRTVDDIDDMSRKISEQFALIPESTRVVIAADWRACRVFTPTVAERAVLMLAQVNARVERSAILHEANQPTSVLQVMRLAREAQLPNRRVFTNTAEMENWLGEVLQPPERERVSAFVARSVDGTGRHSSSRPSGAPSLD